MMRPNQTLRIRLTLLTAALLTLFLPAAVRGSGEGPGEYEVKAAFLYNFAKFTEWPPAAFAGPDDPIIFGILGDDPFGGALEQIARKTVKGRKVVVKRFHTPQEVKVCHVLFIPESESGRVPDILAALNGAPVLLVGDMERFARRGGMINFLMEKNKVLFEINAEAAKRAGLGISAQLLKLARAVY